MNKIWSIFAGLCRALAAALAASVVVSLVVVFIALGTQIVSRNAFSTSILWLEDLLLPGFVVVIFSGVALAFRQRTHLSTSALQDSLPPMAGKIASQLVDLFSMLTMLCLAWLGVQFAQNAFGQFSPVLRLSMGWVYIIVPITCVASALFILENFCNRTDRTK